MVAIDGGNFIPALIGEGITDYNLSTYFIDKYEVSNKEYKEFVDAKGYELFQYWSDMEFILDGESLSWEEAKKLMAEAVYPNGKGFPEVGYLYNTAETHQKVAVSVAKQWENALGVKIKPLNQEWKVYLNSRKSFDYDLARAGWVADMEDPINFLDMFVTDGGNNSTGFSHPQYDELIKKARIENDLTKRSKILEQAEKILMSEVPVIPLFTYTSLNLKQKYISGFYANKLDQHALKHVKIDTAKRKELFPSL